jgi:hypothetical protein
LFWTRLLPYVAVVKAGESVPYRLLLRNNFDRAVTYSARLLPPPGWKANGDFHRLELQPGARGEIDLPATAPAEADGARRLVTAEIRIDGQTQGPVSEALVTVNS